MIGTKIPNVLVRKNCCSFVKVFSEKNISSLYIFDRALRGSMNLIIIYVARNVVSFTVTKFTRIVLTKQAGENVTVGKTRDGQTCH